MRRPVLTLLLACSLLPACSNNSGTPTGPTPPSTPAPSVNTSFTLAPGESATVSEMQLNVRFKSVVNDSRCPADALCITAGEATLALEVVFRGLVVPYEVRTAQGKTTIRFDSYTLELVSLSPYPFGSLPPIQPGDYRATFKITSETSASAS